MAATPVDIAGSLTKGIAPANHGMVMFSNVPHTLRKSAVLRGYLPTVERTQLAPTAEPYRNRPLHAVTIEEACPERSAHERTE
jgi:hypothetical protein